MYQIIRRTWIAVVLVVIAAGCGVHQLKQAQDSFNEAARIEAQTSLEDAEATQDPLIAQALNNYRIAQSLTDDALEQHETSLRQDQLYGTALMLNALCRWRIAALDENVDPQAVRQIIGDVKRRAEAGNVTLGTRDRVLLEALPGLTEHALGLQERDPNQAAELFASALDTLGLSLNIKDPPVPQDHPVRIYVHLAQLRTVRAWRRVAYDHRPTDVDEMKKWYNQWNARYEQYREPLEPLAKANPGIQKHLDRMDDDFGVGRVP